MKEIKVKDVIKICNAKLVCGNEEETLINFKKDTREIKEGDIYVGIKGEKFDGNTFFKVAFENGAKACILQGIDEKELKNYQDKTILIVEDTIEALQKIAEYKRKKYDIPVIGVTGSVGKTSTKDILASVMSEKYNTLKTEGNYNNHIGVPLTILGLKNHEAAVIEMGMNHLGEISKLTKIAKPTIAVITNVGTSHIGELGSRENILKAKLEILEGMQKNSPIIINNDNDMLHNWYIENKDEKNIITYGIETKSDIMAENIHTDEKGSDFTVNIKNKKYKVRINVGGKHFISNSLCAICVGIQNSIPMEQIIEGISKFKLTKKRMETIKGIKDTTIINDCYNASYDSMKAAIEYLGELKGNKKIAVLGDMLELGNFEEELHRKVGKEIYNNNIDILITIGKLAKFIADEAIKSGIDKEKVFAYENKQEGIKKIKEIIEKNDNILIKASNSMKFDEITEAIRKEK